MALKFKVFTARTVEKLQEKVNEWLRNHIDKCEIKSQSTLRDGENIVLSVFYTGKEHSDDWEVDPH